MEYRPRGVLEERLADEDPRPGGTERRVQQFGAHAVRVHRYRDGPQPGGPGDGQHAGVGRRLDEHRSPGRGERAQRGGQRALAARRDQDVGRADAGSDLAGEPGAQFGQPVHGRPVPGTGTAAGPREGCGQGPFGLEGGVEIAAVELDDARRGRGERDEDPRGVDGTGHHLGPAVPAERDLLPGRVARGRGSRTRLGTEGPGAGPGDDQPLGGQLGEGPGDGDRADPEALDESTARRQLSTR